MRRRRRDGFVYLGVLFLVALTSVALAALGRSWATAAQREREAELAWRGEAIARAIESYYRAAPGAAQYPRELSDLLEDRRDGRIRRHLRQLYTDPFTRAADWTLIPAPGQPERFIGVHSRAAVALMRDGPTSARMTSDLLYTAPSAANK